MEKYIKIPWVMEAAQWNKLGDVPEANITACDEDASWTCPQCGKGPECHGRIILGKHFPYLICPGKYVFKMGDEFHVLEEDSINSCYVKGNYTNQEITCPHCGQRHNAGDFINVREDGFNKYVMECEECGKPFWYKYHVVLAIETEKI
jgi:transcription elongation factor Elf1